MLFGLVSSGFMIYMLVIIVSLLLAWLAHRLLQFTEQEFLVTTEWADGYGGLHV